MKALAHIGKQQLKFTFELYICDIRGLPEDVSQVALSWERNGKPLATSATCVTQTTGGAERTAMVDEKINISATLFRNAKRAHIDPKLSLLRVLDMSGGPYVTPGVLGTADLYAAPLRLACTLPFSFGLDRKHCPSPQRPCRARRPQSRRLGVLKATSNATGLEARWRCEHAVNHDSANHQLALAPAEHEQCNLRQLGPILIGRRC